MLKAKLNYSDSEFIEGLRNGNEVAIICTL
jgi:hypothetical protein